MRRAAALLAMTCAALAVPATPASAMCAIPGIVASRMAARPGEAFVVSVAGGRGARCDDVVPAPGTPGPARSVVRVTVYLARDAQRVDLATFRQVGFGHDVTVRVPAGTDTGRWTLASDSGLRAGWRFRVLGPATLPRTASAATLPLAGVGAWLVVAGAYAVVRAGR